MTHGVKVSLRKMEKKSNLSTSFLLMPSHAFTNFDILLNPYNFSIFLYDELMMSIISEKSNLLMVNFFLCIIELNMKIFNAYLKEKSLFDAN